jgi:uncharacterized protein YmfQ (DUF2313 family)
MLMTGGTHMAFYVRARDAAGYITLRRETKEAAEKKADELRQAGYFDIEIVEDAEPEAA